MNTHNNTAIQELFDFIGRCPTAYQTTATTAAILTEQGFIGLQEGEAWNLAAGGKYFVTRNQSSIIAFVMPDDIAKTTGYQIVATHGDSPAFKLKAEFEQSAAKCAKWNVERYGGMICSSWMDRPLSVAGRVVVSVETGIHSRLVHLDRDIALSPNVAIHMDRTVNEGKKYNAQVDMLPLVGAAGAEVHLLDLVAEELGCNKEAIIGHDLFLYARDEGRVWGLENEFISAPRIDNLMCTFGALKGLLGGAHESVVPVLAVFDNEEIGSSSRQGAASSFLADILSRVDEAIAVTDADTQGMYRRIANSCILSADNAHAQHPNHPEYADAQNAPHMNEGIVIKYQSEQRYATDAVSGAIFGRICKAAGVPTQTYLNRSDVRGGSTLGNIVVSKIPMMTLDIGLAQLAMHSAYETAGAKDLDLMITASHAFYHTSLLARENEGYLIDTAL